MQRLPVSTFLLENIKKIFRLLCKCLLASCVFSFSNGMSLFMVLISMSDDCLNVKEGGFETKACVQLTLVR